MDLQYSNYGDFSTEYQSFVTICHCTLLTREGRVLAIG